MLLLHTGLIVMLLAVEVHQVEFVHQASRLEHFESAINRDPVDFCVFLFCEVEQALGIQMLARLINQLEQDLALPGQANSPLLERLFDA